MIFSSKVRLQLICGCKSLNMVFELSLSFNFPGLSGSRLPGQAVIKTSSSALVNAT